MLDKLPLSDVICVYGALDQELEQALLTWKKRSSSPRHILVLSDSEAQQEAFSYCHPNDFAKLHSTLKQYAFLNFEYWHGDNKNHPPQIDAFARVASVLDQIHLDHSDLGDRGLGLLGNMLANQPFFAKSLQAKGLIGKCQKVPAVICGAGPSLSKGIEFLKNGQKEALVFTTGSAHDQLTKHGITPDFCGALDPHPPTSRCFKTCTAPLFFQSRVHPDILKRAKGDLLWVGGSHHDFFDQERFDGGWNSATFLVALAAMMGCDPIILTGVDLAHRKDRAYAGAARREEGGAEFEISKGLFTRSDFLRAAEWLKTFAENHPWTRFVNCSEGLKIEGFSQKVWEEIEWTDQPVNKTISFDNLSKGALVFEGDQIRKSIEKVHAASKGILSLLEKSFPQLPQRDGQYILFEVEMENELFYQQMICPLWQMYEPLMLRQTPPGLPDGMGPFVARLLFIQGVCDEARAL